MDTIKANGSTEKTRRGPPPSESRDAQARFYRWQHGEEPLHVVIDGVAYRRDDDQEQVLLLLRQHDLEADLVAKYGEGAFDLAFRIITVIEDLEYHELCRIENNLKKWLPAHADAVDHCICPDDSRLSYEDFIRHSRCKLP